jgi:hypothetical protein
MQRGCVTQSLKILIILKQILRDETIFELDHPWKDWEIILMCKYIIQYSLALCLKDGIVSFLYMGPVFCHWRQSLTLMGALLHPFIVHVRSIYKLYIKSKIVVPFCLKGMP